MRRKKIVFLWSIPILIIIILSSCNNSPQPEQQQKNPQLSSSSQNQSSFTISGLETPESFQYDPKTDKCFISNIVGSPMMKDGNGYISRFHSNGKEDIKKFITGLDAPKGIAFFQDTLYVTDIDKIYGFDPNTGKKLCSIDLKPQGAEFLNDIVGSKDCLYVSDTHAGIIFRVIPSKKEVSVFSIEIPSPNGLAIHPKTKKLIALSWSKGSIFELDTKGKATLKFDKKFQHLDGAAYDSKGNLYVSDFTQGKIYCISPKGEVHTVKEKLTTPADISIQKDKLVLVPCFQANKAIAIPIDSSSKKDSKK